MNVGRPVVDPMPGSWSWSASVLLTPSRLTRPSRNRNTALTLSTCPARLELGGVHHDDGRWWALHLSQAYPPSCRLKLLTATDIAAYAGRPEQKLCLIYLACWIGVLDGVRGKANWPGCLHADHDFDLKRGGGPGAVPTGRASLDVSIWWCSLCSCSADFAPAS